MGRERVWNLECRSAGIWVVLHPQLVCSPGWGWGLLKGRAWLAVGGLLLGPLIINPYQKEFMNLCWFYASVSSTGLWRVGTTFIQFRILRDGYNAKYRVMLNTC